jgi:predicted nucleic acid-binding protein
VSGQALLDVNVLVALFDPDHVQDSRHRFWHDCVSLVDEQLFDLSVVGGHRHLTDIYLLGLATKMSGRLVTFDRGIPVKAVLGGGSALEVIAPAGE